MRHFAHNRRNYRSAALQKCGMRNCKTQMSGYATYQDLARDRDINTSRGSFWETSRFGVFSGYFR
jgi:hypothetical protein